MVVPKLLFSLCATAAKVVVGTVGRLFVFMSLAQNLLYGLILILAAVRTVNFKNYLCKAWGLSVNYLMSVSFREVGLEWKKKKK